MAREYGRILTSSWDDKDWRALDPYHQGVYGALLSYQGISWCGVIDYIPKRLTEFSDAMTPKKLHAAVGYLSERNFTRMDADTDELLVRTFVRHDGVLKMRNVGKAMVTALGRVHSPLLREMVVAELARLRVEQPELKGWDGVRDSSPELLAEVLDKANRRAS